jgi:hypothetical protein
MTERQNHHSSQAGHPPGAGGMRTRWGLLLAFALAGVTLAAVSWRPTKAQGWPPILFPGPSRDLLNPTLPREWRCVTEAVEAFRATLRAVRGSPRLWQAYDLVERDLELLSTDPKVVMVAKDTLTDALAGLALYSDAQKTLQALGLSERATKMLQAVVVTRCR